MKSTRTLLIGAWTAILAVGLVAARPAGAVTTWRMYNWMQPPSDTTGSTACLIGPDALWHGTYDAPGRALDWKATCGSSQPSGNIYYRSRNAAPDDLPGDFVQGRGEPIQQESIRCGLDVVHYAWVKIRSDWDGLLKGVATYQHAQLTTTAAFDIVSRGGGSWSNAALNSRIIGYETDDSDAGSGCWTAFHVHENNRNTSLWDYWNTSYYNSAGDKGDKHRNDVKETWTRRLLSEDTL